MIRFVNSTSPKEGGVQFSQAVASRILSDTKTQGNHRMVNFISRAMSEFLTFPYSPQMMREKIKTASIGVAPSPSISRRVRISITPDFTFVEIY